MSKKTKSSPTQVVKPTLTNNLKGKIKATSIPLTTKQKPLVLTNDRDTTSKVIPQHVPQFTVAQVDPFSPNAVGAKWPDECSYRSATFMYRDELVMTTDATYGGSAHVYRPDPSLFKFQNATQTSATAWTWSADWTTNGTSLKNITPFRNAYDLVRCVGFGIKLSAKQTVTAATGNVHVAIIPEDLSASGQNTAYPTSIQAMQASPWYVRTTMQELLSNTMSAQGKITSGSAASRYRSANQQWNVGAAQLTAGLESELGWGDICVVVESGSTGTAVLTVDVIYHYEVIPSVSTNAILSTSAPAPYSPIIIAGTKNVTDNMPAAYVNPSDTNTNKSFWNDVGNLFTQGSKVAMGIVSGIKTVSNWWSNLFS